MKRLLLAITSFLTLFVLVKPARADRLVNSVTLNGSSSVSVAPSASVTAFVTVSTDALNDKNWRSTSWNISGANCINHVDHNGTGTYNETFTVTAPSSYGTYNISFIAYADSACSTAPSPTYTLIGGIVVPSPTPTAGPTPTPTPTLTPGQPTPSPTPTTSSGGSSTSTTYYPSQSLDAFQNPTNKTSLVFSGTARVEQGSISLIEYTLTNESSWIQAQPIDGSFNNKDERFTFNLANLAEGKYTLKVRAKTASGVLTQEGSYTSTVLVIATSPPLVTLDTFAANPTKDKTPTLTGRVIARLADITKVELSLDGGKSWHIVSRTGSKFSFTPATLEDGNYPLIARALDSAGNIGQTDPKILIIDTIPPILGGSMISIGPQVLTPSENGSISIAAEAQVTIAISMEGGVTQAQVESQSSIFPLAAREGDNVWVGSISFDTQGEKPLSVVAVDGAGNTTQREFNTLIVESPGMVIDSKTANFIQDAEISLYTYDTISLQWTLWESESYGQSNPQITNSNGSYSFIIPAGRYYLEAKAEGYKTLQSEIISPTKTSILNYALPLTPNTRIKLTLPLLGPLQIILPSFTPPQTLKVESATTPAQIITENKAFKTGILAPDFTLPDIHGKQINLSSFKGKKLLLSFIAPWSTPSLEQAPILSVSYTSVLSDQTILVVSLQESIATTQTLMNRGRYQFPVVVDKDGKTASEYQVTTLPHHVLVDSNGNIREIFTGVFTKEQLLEKLSNI